MRTVSADEIELLIEAARRNRLSFVRVKSKDKSIKIETSLGAQVITRAGEQVAIKFEPPAKLEHTVTSSLVGYFRPAQISVGSLVKENTIVGVIESLGLTYDVQAGYNGKVDEIMAMDGDAVEFGQPLLRIRA